MFVPNGVAEQYAEQVVALKSDISTKEAIAKACEHGLNVVQACEIAKWASSLGYTELKLEGRFIYGRIDEDSQWGVTAIFNKDDMNSKDY